MTDKQPEALRLADEFDGLRRFSPEHFVLLEKAAAELRRLHEENESLKASVYGVYELERINAELVEALSVVIRGVPDTWEGVKQAKVVLDKAKEKNNG